MEVINLSKLKNSLIRVKKPTRYTGEEYNITKKDWESVDLKIGLIYPDIYEVGMSHLGLKILYHLLNSQDDILAERIYAPWPDMERELREGGMPLFSLESKRRARDFDILGFTLQYELSYTNLLNILDLSQIPLYAQDRDKTYPLIMAGGPNAFNPEPLSPFIDLFVIGEGEEVILEIFQVYRTWKREGGGREDLLKELGERKGIYVPSLYAVEEDRRPSLSKNSIQKRLVEDLDGAFYPRRFIVPYMDIVHDRVMLEIARGCGRGCRFCQAGILYRPVRERSPERLQEMAHSLLSSTGYDEISLTSLSSSDYSQIKKLSTSLMDTFSPLKVGISLPSMRLDSFSISLAHQVLRVRKTGLTFAPEAGTQRLRQVINKGIQEEDLKQSVSSAFSLGWKSLKLYFMIGLPTEVEEDIEAIARLAQEVYSIGKREARGGVRLTVSIANFVPKAHTPFQWVPFLPIEELDRRLSYVKDRIHSLKGRIALNWHDPGMSLVEAILARGDRRLAPILAQIQREGGRFHGWSEHFQLSHWQKVFRAHGMDMEEQITREIPLHGDLPWDFIASGVSREFLEGEYRRALEQEVTPDCREVCQGCGVSKYLHLFHCRGDIL